MNAASMDLQPMNRPDAFSKAIWISVIAHVVLVLGFTIKIAFFTSEPIVFENAIRVDMVALPDKYKPQAQALPQPEPVMPVPVPKKQELPKKKNPDAINLDKTKKQQKAAMEKLRQMDTFEKLKHEVEVEKRLQKAATFKGNQLSAGTELRGVTRLQHDNYIADVKKRIYANWSLPEWLAHKELSAQVLIRLDGQGNITYHKIHKSSGNPSFDDAALETIQQSSPVAAPPEKFAQILAVDGVLIGFPE